MIRPIYKWGIGLTVLGILGFFVFAFLQIRQSWNLPYDNDYYFYLSLICLCLLPVGLSLVLATKHRSLWWLLLLLLTPTGIGGIIAITVILNLEDKISKETATVWCLQCKSQTKYNEYEVTSSAVLYAPQMNHSGLEVQSGSFFISLNESD